ncbi:MAG: hypothetical protein ACK5BN_13330, partial [Planctomycetota bacterium]
MAIVLPRRPAVSLFNWLCAGATAASASKGARMRAFMVSISRCGASRRASAQSRRGRSPTGGAGAMGPSTRLKPAPKTPMIVRETAMSDPVRNAGPIDAAGGFAGRAGGFVGGRRPTPSPAGSPGVGRDDDVVLAAIAGRARRLLRERVLTATRRLLQLADGDGDAQPSFAEAVDDESIGEFVGRLLSAQ